MTKLPVGVSIARITHRSGTVTMAWILAALLLLTSLGIANAYGDVTPPQVVSGTLSPAVIDTSGGPATVSVSILVQDDLSGVNRVTAVLRTEDYRQSHVGRLSRVSGDDLLGVWAGEIVVPRFAAEGKWFVDAQMRDNAANNKNTLVRVDGLPVSLRNGLSAPSPPSAVDSQVADGQANVSWTRSADDGGSPITGYTATASPGGQACSTTGALTCTVTGLTNGTAYTFTVTATNSAGTSRPSEPSAPVTPFGKPGAVSNLEAAPAKGSLRLTWSPPADMGGASSVTYQYQVGRQAWKSTSVTSVTVRGKKGLRITLKVRAVNESGPGPSISVSGVPR